MVKKHLVKKPKLYTLKDAVKDGFPKIVLADVKKAVPLKKRKRK